MYNFAISFYGWIVRFASLFHGKARKMVKGQQETFDILKEKLDKEASYIWIHAASLGEFEQGRPLIEKIKAEEPQTKILLTFFSPSGYEVRKDYPLADIVCYLPFDFPGNARKFVSMVNPAKAIFIKYEIWANYLSELHKRNIPTFLVSAIFRETQLFFKPHGKGYRKSLNYFTHFFVQNEESRALLHSIGLDNTTITGDTRFDRVNAIYQQRKEIPLVALFTASNGETSPTLVVGSSWEKDEDIIIPWFNNHPEVKMILVPHEFNEERIKAIQGRLQRPSIALSQATDDSIQEADCLIIDCFGLLSSIYRYATVAYIGGGFGAGIHNIVEAAVYGIPVVFGPNHRKFKEAADLIARRGAFSITDPNSFASCVDRFFAQPDSCREAGRNAKEYVAANLGATDKIYSFINKT